MRKPTFSRALALAALALAGCTTGQANTTPPIDSGGGGGGSSNVALQLAVGTVNFGGLGAGINVLETFRGPDGYTAIPISTAVFKGPSGFRAPKGSKDPGTGLSAVPIGSANNQFVIGGATSTQTLAGADGWGIGPPSCSCEGVNFYPFQPQFSDVTLPFLFPGGSQPFYGGPPAYPPTSLEPSSLSPLVSIPSSWSEGFYFMGLDAAPPAGTYSLTVSYQQNGRTTTKRATAQLASPHLLPSILGKATAVSDGKGGLIVTVAFVPGVKQMLVNVIDANVPPAPPPSGGTSCLTGLGFASLVFTASGTQRIPDDLGNYGQGGAPTFCKGDTLEVSLIGFDYDDLHLGPPFDYAQRPALPARADATYGTLIAAE